jgi:cytochrome c-type biogenesis protein CcsB
MSILVLVLALGTCLESLYGEAGEAAGAAAARFAVYGAWWFTMLGALLGLNIFSALVIRFPWRRRLLGFVTTHVGLLVLLLGCWVTRHWGVEAELGIFEHRAAGHAYQENAAHFELSVLPAEQADPAEAAEPISIAFHPGPFDWQDYDRLPWFPWKLVGHDQGLTYDRDGIRLEVLDYYADYRLAPIPRLELLVSAAAAADSPHGGLSMGRPRLPVELSVQAASGPHGMGGRYGMGTREDLSGGQQLNFWMTGSAEETAAFRQDKPDGRLGKLGRVALRARGADFQWPLDDWKAGQRKPLGQTGLEVELVRVESGQEGSGFRCVRLKIHRLPSPTGRGAGGEGEPQPMSLFADLPISNQQDYSDGVFGTYWRDVPQEAPHDSPHDSAPQGGLRDAGRPRIDILQGADQQLYIRTWRAGKLEPAEPLPIDGDTWSAFEGTTDAVALLVERFIPAEKPDMLPTPLSAEEKKTHKGPRRRRAARVRLTVDDGAAEEFWLSTNWEDPLEKLREKATSPAASLRRVVQGPRRRVAVELHQDALDLAVDVRLHHFRKVLYPHTEEAMQYSSLVDVVDRATEKSVEYAGKPLSERTIAMNAPLDFAHPATGQTYRLYQHGFYPQPPERAWPPEEFDLKPQEGEDLIYISYLSVATDPGRGLKYAGCILVVAGVFLVYFVRRKSAALAACLALACVPLLGTSSARAAETLLPGGSGTPASLDWAAWQRLPVFHEGRVMPLDSFARAVVKRICGAEQPTLPLGDEGGAAATTHRFAAAELLFDWLAEPEKWEDIALLPADDENLRRDVLDVPLQDKNGWRLHYVSPRQVSAAATKFLARLQQVAKRQDTMGHDGPPPPLTAMDQAVENLYESFAHYRELTFNPLQPAQRRGRFLKKLDAALEAWNPLEEHLMRPPLGDAQGDFGKLVQQAAEAARKLTALALAREEPPLAEIEPAAAALEEATRQLAQRLDDLRRSGRRVARTAEPKDEVRRAQELLEEMADYTGKTARLAAQAHAALYDNGFALRLLPAMDPSALEADRYRSDDSPWLSAQVVLSAPAGMLRDYPEPQLKEARQAYQDALAAYRHGKDPRRPEQFSAAMDRFAAALRSLGEAIEPQRRQLPIREREDEVLDLTAYPPGGSTGLEVHYNQLDPFFWAWVACAAAAASLALSLLGRLRKPAFWTGIALLAAVETLIVAGFIFRGCITGWIPLTNMFETFVFVGMCLAAAGALLALLPPREVYARRPVALVGALLALLALMVAYYVPTFHKEIGLVSAVLRSNFWLAIHVTTIMTSYGTAAMACGLGLIALGGFLFGHYEARGQGSGIGDKAPRLRRGGMAPPRISAILAPMIYLLLKLTVLLLAIGTILGAMWADVSWGRFWGWDPKEVWALISLLVYMILLHARHVGWASPFNLAAGSVLGLLVILWTYYGVNYVMRAGKHSYGQGGAGGPLGTGTWVMLGVLAAILIFLGAAAVRYARETGRGEVPAEE